MKPSRKVFIMLIKHYLYAIITTGVLFNSVNATKLQSKLGLTSKARLESELDCSKVEGAQRCADISSCANDLAIHRIDCEFGKNTTTSVQYFF